VDNNDNRASWSGQVAFVLAAAASAIGLGNLWRFPYLAAHYGGGAFIATYLVLSLTLGTTLLITEIAIGRKSRQSQLTAFTRLGHRRWAWVGFLSTLVPFLIAPYYAVIGGWVVKYFTAYLIASLHASPSPSPSTFDAFVASGHAPFLFMCVFIVATAIVILKGVKNGIERANLVLLPLLLAMAIALAVYVAFLPGAADGIRYYLVPDFARSGSFGKMVLGAMGQMFFSLSLAMGIMMTYGSYMRKRDSISRSAVRIVFADTFVAVLAGFMVIPVVYAFAVSQGLDPNAQMKQGVGLLFKSLPEIFGTLGSGGAWAGLAFFALALFAALTSAISMTEACVAAICDFTGLSRRRATVLFAAFCIATGAISAYSTSALESIDTFVNAALMPVTAIGICLYAGWILKPGRLVRELRHDRSRFPAQRIYALAIRFIAPALVAAILVSEICRALKIGGWSI